jgi:hypothetical protein
VFQALEVLALGIQGKMALWRVLKNIVWIDSRLQGTDFERLIARAEEQFSKVEEQRLRVARSVFQPAAATADAWTP